MNSEFKIELYKNEGIPNFNNKYFPPHFLMLLIGKPGSGKTTLLKHLLKKEDLFFKKFNKVFIVSPSFKEFSSLFLPQGNFNDKLDMVWIEKKLKEVKKECETQYKNILFIFDDVLSSLDHQKNSEEVMNFVFNRRHKLNDNGMVSIIITSQKFNKIPTAIRANVSVLIFFKLNVIDYKLIFDDIIYSEKDEFEEILKMLNTSENSDFIIYRIDYNKYFLNFRQISFTNSD